MSTATESAIAFIWANYDGELSLADIAKSASLSRFHFSRTFRNATGVSPGRFLSAVRIYQAKRMLVATSATVTDISLAVGYNSLGSFTNHFTGSVGISPGRFRRMSKDGSHELPKPAPGTCQFRGTVAGPIDRPSGYGSMRVYLGAFRTPIVQGRPISSALVVAGPDRLTSYRLTDVPVGEWFVRAVAVADSTDPEPWTSRSSLVGGQRGAIKVTTGTIIESEIYLSPRRRTDLPILLALPDLDEIMLAMPDRPTEPTSTIHRRPPTPAANSVVTAKSASNLR
jgi:AraC family transcriptional regulator